MNKYINKCNVLIEFKVQNLKVGGLKFMGKKLSHKFREKLQISKDKTHKFKRKIRFNREKKETRDLFPSLTKLFVFF